MKRFPASKVHIQPSTWLTGKFPFRGGGRGLIGNWVWPKGYIYPFSGDGVGGGGVLEAKRFLTDSAQQLSYTSNHLRHPQFSNFQGHIILSKSPSQQKFGWRTDILRNRSIGCPWQGRTKHLQDRTTFHSFISNSWRRQEFKKRSILPKISCKIWLTKEMCRNIFLIFLWNIFAETKFSGLLPNPSSGDFITLKVDRKCGMRKHEKVILDWFWELKVYFKLGTAILAWRMFVTWAFSSNSLHNVAFIKYWRNNGDSRSLPFFSPLPLPPFLLPPSRLL